MTGALKRYQKRKGFAVTGTVDQDTATSLHIQAAAVLPRRLARHAVLKSDTARELPESQRIALKEQPRKTGPPPDARSARRVARSRQDLTPERVNKFVEDLSARRAKPTTSRRR